MNHFTICPQCGREIHYEAPFWVCDCPKVWPTPDDTGLPWYAILLIAAFIIYLLCRISQAGGGDDDNAWPAVEQVRVLWPIVSLSLAWAKW
jgi:hypothetical protein